MYSNKSLRVVEVNVMNNAPLFSSDCCGNSRRCLLLRFLLRPSVANLLWSVGGFLTEAGFLETNSFLTAVHLSP